MKKGVSSLLVTVLLVGFTIALGYIFFAWISELFKEDKSTSNCEAELLKLCQQNSLEILNVKVNDTGAINISIQNTGRYEVKSLRTLTYLEDDTIYAGIINFSRPLLPWLPVNFTLNYVNAGSNYKNLEVLSILSATFAEETCETICYNKATYSFTT